MPAPTIAPDPYSVLGVPRTATAAEIRAAYRALGARFHPDRHQGNPLEELAATRMQEINRAYESLSDPRRRAAHDDLDTRPSPGGSRRRAPRPASSQTWGRWLGAILLFPFLLRFGMGAARVLARGVVAAAEALGALRGTPAVAAGMLLVTGLLTFAFVRRRKINKG
jgi:curved DNA-binding protein CbpA